MSEVTHKLVAAKKRAHYTSTFTLWSLVFVLQIIIFCAPNKCSKITLRFSAICFGAPTTTCRRLSSSSRERQNARRKNFWTSQFFFRYLGGGGRRQQKIESWSFVFEHSFFGLFAAMIMKIFYKLHTCKYSLYVHTLRKIEQWPTFSVIFRTFFAAASSHSHFFA